MRSSIMLILLLLLLFPVTSWSAAIQYDLAVSLDPTTKKIAGVAHITAATATEISLSVSHLRHVKLDEVDAVSDAAGQVRLKLKKNLPVRITYEAVADRAGSSWLDPENAFLIDTWYPVPDVLARYSLSTTLPDGFIAISESEAVETLAQDGTTTFRFNFRHPLDRLHLVASTRYATKKEAYNGISIETYFYREDEALADTYIAHAKKYLSMYAAMLTPYPYKRFAIVANNFSTGYSMPTFTLLGRDVIRLPFIVKTSLGHEILHQWFGNMIYPDYAHGNWAEGLVNYLADHHYADLQGEGRQFRKQIMINYAAYVNSGNTMPVSSFSGRRNKAQAAIGYGKTAMIFHELRQRFGKDRFFAALREFIRQNAFRLASWHDIQRAFEKTTGAKLYAYFDQRLNRTDIPAFTVEKPQLQVAGGHIELRFNLVWAGKPYTLSLPLNVHFPGGISRYDIDIETSPQEVVIPLDQVPVKVIIDEDYDVMRKLSPDERPAVLADIMGLERLTVAIRGGQRGKYQPLIDALGVSDLTYVDANKVTYKMIKEDSFVIAGFDNLLVDTLLGGREISAEGVRLEVYKNPYDLEKRLLLLHTRDKAQTQAVKGKIPHYGKYTQLAFNEGNNTHKSIGPSQNGQVVLTRPEPLVIEPAKQESLEDIFPELQKKRIIFVGEQHDRFAHHFNQLFIIKKLHDAGAKIAVGMEMFRTPYQPAIDDYMAGRIDERKFLAASNYFEQWGYDYNLYKPLIDFIKKNKIPLLALNFDQDISRKTARKGIDGLSKKERRQLAAKLDFSDLRYRADLRKIFGLHNNKNDLADFNLFLQAQTLWDETMAENARRFLIDNPDSKLIVLAGNGHLRHTYGIPARLYHRLHASFTVIVQDDEIEDGIADYVLLTTELKGVRSPRLGVSVEDKNGQLVILEAINKSPAHKAELKKGDIITRIDGQPIKTLGDLKIALFYIKTGDKVKIELKRNGEILTKEIDFSRPPEFRHP